MDTSHDNGNGMLIENHFIAPEQTASVSSTTGMFGQLEFVGGTKRRLLNSSATSLEDARQAKFCRVRVQPDVSHKTLRDLTPSEQANRIGVIRGLVDYIS